VPSSNNAGLRRCLRAVAFAVPLPGSIALIWWLHHYDHSYTWTPFIFSALLTLAAMLIVIAVTIVVARRKVSRRRD
jgi:hypothetical protein